MISSRTGETTHNLRGTEAGRLRSTAQVYGIPSFPYALKRMRVRVLRSSSGVIDRVKLSSFKPGLSYDVHPSLGQYLVSQRFAEELRDSSPVLIVPMDATTYMDDLNHVHGGVHVVQERDTADHTPSRRPRKKR